MDGSCYFENEPWILACSEISMAETYDDIVEVNIQCVCQDNSADAMREKWEKRLSEILNPPQTETVIHAGKALSKLFSYPNGAIVRMFIDEGNSESFENFEIVTKKALYIWRPASHPQGYIETLNKGECICTQLFSTGLEVL